MWVKIVKMFFKICVFSWYFEFFFFEDEYFFLEDYVKVYVVVECFDYG